MQLLDVRACLGMARPTLESEIRRRSASVYLGEDRVLCRAFGRYGMFLSARDVGFASHLMLDGFWEIWIAKFLVSCIQPGDVVLDVGANYGYYSLIFSDCVGPGGKCISFEPNPDVARELRRSLAINGFFSRSVVHELALSDESGHVRFFVPRDEPKNGRILAAPASVRDPEAGVSFEVRLDRGDRILEAEPRVDLIKIDAEGAEAAIVRGLEGTIERHKPKMLIEVNAGRDYDLAALLVYLQSMYGVIRIVDGESRAVKTEAHTVLNENVGEDYLLYFSPPV
ncbi:MAG: FkbM family methyltransferase [Vicinamibacteria bacterium]|nr:FkbM family methyltransferase [Vicinamibacteria bacterium]